MRHRVEPAGRSLRRGALLAAGIGIMLGLCGALLCVLGWRGGL